MFLRLAPHWHVEQGAYLGLRFERFGWALAAERGNPHRRPLADVMDALQVLELTARDALNETD